MRVALLAIGWRHGGWTVTAQVVTATHVRYRVSCDTCGAEVIRERRTVIVGPQCRACTWAHGSCTALPDHIARSRAFYKVPKIDPDLSLDSDVDALELMEERGSLSLTEIGAAMGFSRERARQIQERALRRLAVGLRLHGIPDAEINEWLDRPRSSHAMSGASGEVSEAGGAPIRQRYEPLPVPPEAFYSEHGQRLDALARDLEARAAYVDEVTARAAAASAREAA